jgi:hypothetical protein
LYRSGVSETTKTGRLKKTGIFELRQILNITDRGFVGVGYFIEGFARIGDQANIQALDKSAEVVVAGIARGNPVGEGDIPFGILFQFKSERLEKGILLRGIMVQLIECYERTKIE